MALFAAGSRICAEKGLILVDTKYELGKTRDGEIVVIDEIHTPDSSRFWFEESYETRFAAGEDPESFDKEFVREWLTSPASGWDRASGEAPPPLPAEVVERTRAKYVDAYERLTGRPLPS